ncbi:uncharacterized protein TM35_000491400 [Trypanosoma theileri]|uniref:Uncharacterized protein n=1 Tax=Trypanosoma theileri TaxID=67003 RepID=A0A1X0NH96_9TRYP|nr:uncharacterized protein TM35_000491400 [Trypanosoma theileri]ORC84134.1 hypothetical protein TM35_000491400 [Trypanosoma theileri]
MHNSKTVVVRTNVVPEEEEEETLAVFDKSKALAHPSPVVPAVTAADSDDEFSIPYIAHASTSTHVASVRSVSLKRPRSSNNDVEETVGTNLDTEMTTALPDDTDHPQDRAAYAEWKKRDGARQKQLLQI